ncbi:hypothetical protein E1B28_010002 [Marasmius oreades]|uniref:Distal membrane-arm assembly complex protein 1-like domain-containing protein n=1 Tax=Marasmius oreades TaxID=181124 RepID=A0A9P7RWA6_9AGAR|nr:uncharacterized protein E1B28_010002 [Marasmius oreades]KAG7090929.1 hypothetical protein E1B28_010002 [Marasmius oreades]
MSTSAINASTRPKDCLSCRVIGTTTLTGVGGYALWQSRTIAAGTPLQKRLMSGVGVALILGGGYRWFN